MSEAKPVASGKKILAWMGAVAVLAAVLIAVGSVAVNANVSETKPQVTFFADQHSVTADPVKYCDIHVKDCSTGSKAHLNVPPGSPVQISLPNDVSSAPWNMTLEYLGPNGRSEYVLKTFAPGSRRAVTVQPAPGNRQLLTIEINLPSAIVDRRGEPFSRAYWALDTTPAGLLRQQAQDQH